MKHISWKIPVILGKNCDLWSMIWLNDCCDQSFPQLSAVQLQLWRTSNQEPIGESNDAISVTTSNHCGEISKQLIFLGWLLKHVVHKKVIYIYCEVLKNCTNKCVVDGQSQSQKFLHVCVSASWLMFSLTLWQGMILQCDIMFMQSDKLQSFLIIKINK